jgi:hypothetical protein
MSKLEWWPNLAQARIPLQKWYSEDVQHHIAATPPQIPDEWKTVYGNNLQSISDILPAAINALVHELQTVEQFIAALNGRENFSMRQFVDLANETFNALARRCDIKLRWRWTAKNLDAPHYLPQGGFTFAEMIEAAARLQEFQMLSTVTQNHEILTQWYESSIFDVYKPAYDWLLNQVGDPGIARILLDVAFTSPIDPSCRPASGTTFYVEDVLPSWRLPRIVEAAKNEFWPSSTKEKQKFAGSILAHRAGVPSADMALKSSLEVPFTGPKGWGADASRLQDYEARPNTLLYSNPAEYILYIEKEVARAFRRRLQDPLAFIAPSDMPDTFQPLLEFFSDFVRFDCDLENKSSDTLHLTAFLGVVLSRVALALWSDGDVSDLREPVTLFFSRFDETSGLSNGLDLPGLLDKLIDERYKQCLRW